MYLEAALHIVHTTRMTETATAPDGIDRLYHNLVTATDDVTAMYERIYPCEAHTCIDIATWATWMPVSY